MYWQKQPLCLLQVVGVGGRSEYFPTNTCRKSSSVTEHIPGVVSNAIQLETHPHHIEYGGGDLLLVSCPLPLLNYSDSADIIPLNGTRL